ncbi:MAG: gliding motility-associated C-terminal domain-containing protein [Flavobacteriales bacterium]|nr:gliding motility-associated C-terminal domain-containing protein [Flavobacteriales bacterium]
MERGLKSINLLFILLLTAGNNIFSQSVTFTTPGTTTWVVPPCVTSITVHVWGGGGGGGGAASNQNQSDDEACSQGGGGGGGGFAGRTYSVTPGETYTIVVGAGGTGGPGGTSNATANNGGNGGTSKFYGPATIPFGDLTGYGGNGGGGAWSKNTSNGFNSHIGFDGAGGTGNGGANGTSMFNGGNGSSGRHSASCYDASGAGGGGAGTGANGGNGTAPNSCSLRTGGAGGSSGGGNGADGEILTSYSVSRQFKPGKVGQVIGGGGGGAMIHLHSWPNSWTTVAGGAGARGEVRITYTTPSLPEPTFNPISPICNGDVLAPLPTTSTNGYNGTWSPAINNAATTTYVFTPDPSGPCADTASLTIVVNSKTTPTFNASTPICSGDFLSPLPTTSTNGFSGTWSPALNNTATTTYTFTPTAGQCANNATHTITVNNSTTPSFNTVSPICSGETLSPLPTTSTNGITGTWSPALNNTTTTTYIFTPNSGQCASSTTVTITVNSSTTPTFNAVAPICSGDVLSPLPTTSTNGINGSWSPAINNTTTTTYTFTPNIGQCAATTTLSITVNPPSITPTFNAVAPICSGYLLSPLPTTSTNGINGSWSPAINNTTTTTYTFSPSSGQCANSATIIITVNSLIEPSFNSIQSICTGETLNTLSTTSINGISGTWSPAINNTATTTYIFTPDAGQCADTTALTIVVNSIQTPVFSTVAPICSGEVLNPLPTTSTNGFSGTWSPALNNTATTTYTFTPTAGQCANTASLTITVNNSDTPTFASVPSICSGEVLTPLPTTSTNGINGTWSPALNNTTTTTYTFTPSTGQCATTTTLTITVNQPNATPTFTAVSPICSGDVLNPLPTTSTNGISGVWSPAINNTTTTTYTFLPDAGQCGVGTTMNIVVNPLPNLVVTDPTPVCSPNTVDITATSVTSGSTSGTSLTYWTNPSASNSLINPSSVSNSATYYIKSTTADGCSLINPVTVLINEKPNLNITNPESVCSPNTINLTVLGITAGSTGNGSLSYWQDANASIALTNPSSINSSGTYYIQSTTSAGCKDIKPVTVTIDTISIPTISVNDTSGCAPLCVQFSGSSSGSVSSWLWNFGDGSVENTQNPSHCFTTSGQSQTSLTVVGANGCSATSQPLTLNVYQNPSANFYASSNTISMLQGDSSVQFFNQSSGDVTQWLWTFGTSPETYSTIPNPSIVYPFSNPGTYTVNLTVQNAYGCSDTKYQEIIVEPYFTFYIPNVFTPDGDGKNDVFLGVGIGIIEYELMIFDRWGEKIFVSDNLYNGWDGKAKGGSEIAQQDVYVWKVKILDILNKKHDLIGKLTLIK